MVSTRSQHKNRRMNHLYVSLLGPISKSEFWRNAATMSPFHDWYYNSKASWPIHAAMFALWDVLLKSDASNAPKTEGTGLYFWFLWHASLKTHVLPAVFCQIPIVHFRKQDEPTIDLSDTKAYRLRVPDVPLRSKKGFSISRLEREASHSIFRIMLKKQEVSDGHKASHLPRLSGDVRAIISEYISPDQNLHKMPILS